MLLVQLIQHAPLLADAAQHAHATLSTLAAHHSAIAAAPPTPTPTPTPPASPNGGNGQDSLHQLYTFVQQMQAAIFYIGGFIFLIGIVLAGMMRMLSMGNERRVAMSNIALTAAVVGLVIMLMGNGLYSFFSTAFPQP